MPTQGETQRDDQSRRNIIIIIINIEPPSVNGTAESAVRKA
ncbi:hypothetical protein X750_09875 [Mesorhizobium sp. LNJC394B00]|nr:hypothetical protein X752_14765 [Mesorhizobium sp. LNJC398B00]ESY24338.1 hypothetical protein X750_09875 [Mesorhizobium sp. LNJC394B00]